MHDEVAGALLRVGDAEAHALAAHGADVADLTAGFAVERRLVEDNRAACSGLEAFDLAAVAHDRRNDAFRAFGVVAQKFRRADLFAQGEPQRVGRRLAGAGPRSPRSRVLRNRLSSSFSVSAISASARSSSG